MGCAAGGSSLHPDHRFVHQQHIAAPGDVLDQHLAHKLIAERFLSDQKTEEKNLVGAINGNKLDCRLENLAYRSRAVASRKRKTTSKTGYTGVYKENNKYRAMISINRKPVHIGMYDTPEEAALAYNKKSREIFGEHGKQNVIKSKAKRQAMQNGLRTSQ